MHTAQAEYLNKSMKGPNFMRQAEADWIQKYLQQAKICHGIFLYPFT